jgi:hypothetical protein
MLPHLLQINKGIFQSLADGRHPAQCRPLELLALEQALSIFEKADVVASDSLDKGFGGVQLTESDAEMVRIVQSVEQIAVERVDVLEAWEGRDGGGQPLGKRLRRIFDFSSVKRSNTADLEAGTDLSGKAPLSSGEDNVQKLLAGGHDRNVLPLRLHGGG